MTEDLSKTGVQISLDMRKPIGAEVDFAILTPSGEISGDARVVREEQRSFGAHATYFHGLEFIGMHGQGYELLDKILSPVKRRPAPRPVRRAAKQG